MQSILRIARQQPVRTCQPLAAQRATISRPFSSAFRLRIKEDADRSPEEVENAKQEQLKKQEKGEGEWHRELASSSEEHIGADKEQVHDHDEHMEDLQKQTAEKHEKDHPDGKDSH